MSKVKIEVMQRMTDGTTHGPFPFELPEDAKPYYDDMVEAGFHIVVGCNGNNKEYPYFSELWKGDKCKVSSLCKAEQDLGDVIAESLRLEPWLLPDKPADAG